MKPTLRSSIWALVVIGSLILVSCQPTQVPLRPTATVINKQIHSSTAIATIPSTPSATLTQFPQPTFTEIATLTELPTSTITPSLSPTTTIESPPIQTPTQLPNSLKGFGILSQRDPGVLYYYKTGKPGWSTLKVPESLMRTQSLNGGEWFAMQLVNDLSNRSGIYLDLLHLTDNQIIPVARLDSDWPDQADEKVNQAKGALEDGRILGSPDGQFLAFPAAMGGSLNADVYLAQTASPDLIRLTHQSLNVQLMAWTPDSRQVIYSVSKGWDNLCYADTTVWSVSLDGKARKLYSAGCSMGEEVLGFTQNDQMVTNTLNPMGVSDRLHLRRVDLSTGQTKMIYTGYFIMAALDPVHGKVLFNALTAGEYDYSKIDYDLVSVANPEQVQKINIDIETISNNISEMMHSITWLPEAGRFVVIEKSSLLVGPDGSITPFPTEYSPPLDSPDGTRLVFNGGMDRAGFRVYDLTGKLLHEVTTPDPVGLFDWSHDGKGLFYFTMSNGATLTLYYQDLSTDSPDLMVQGFPTGQMTFIH